MGRRKHSKIDNLEPAVKETVDEMIKTGAYYREIVDYIQSHGVSISLAAVGKYAKNLMSTLDALRLSQENFRAIMEETDRYPDLDMTDGILRLLCNQMLDAINKTSCRRNGCRRSTLTPCPKMPWHSPVQWRTRRTWTPRHEICWRTVQSSSRI